MYIYIYFTVIKATMKKIIVNNLIFPNEIYVILSQALTQFALTNCY